MAAEAGFYGDVISCELAQRGVWRGQRQRPSQASVGVITAVSLTSIHDRRQFLPVRCHASAGTSYGPASVYLCLSQVSVLSKR